MPAYNQAFYGNVCVCTFRVDFYTLNQLHRLAKQDFKIRKNSFDISFLSPKHNLTKFIENGRS